MSKDMALNRQIRGALAEINHAIDWATDYLEDTDLEGLDDTFLKVMAENADDHIKKLRGGKRDLQKLEVDVDTDERCTPVLQRAATKLTAIEKFRKELSRQITRLNAPPAANPRPPEEDTVRTCRMEHVQENFAEAVRELNLMTEDIQALQLTLAEVNLDNDYRVARTDLDDILSRSKTCSEKASKLLDIALSTGLKDIATELNKACSQFTSSKVTIERELSGISKRLSCTVKPV